MKGLRNILLLLISPPLIFWAGEALAQSAIVNFESAAYGAANKNWGVDIDDYGSVYIGNDYGLVEFDGLKWRTSSLPSRSVIRSVAALSHDTIFTGGFQDFGRWDRDSAGVLHYTSLFEQVDGTVPISDGECWRIEITDDGVWFQTFNALYKYDFKSVKIVSIVDGSPFMFLMHSGEQLWLSDMGGGVYRIVGDKLHRVDTVSLFKGTCVMVMLPAVDNKILVGTARRGLFLYDGVNFKRIDAAISDKLSMAELNCGIRTSRGTYMFGTINDGMYEVSADWQIIEHISAEGSLCSDTVQGIAEDSSGNVWLTLDDGLAYVRHSDNFKVYNNLRRQYGSSYAATLWRGNLYLGTNTGVYYTPYEQLKSGMAAGFTKISGADGQIWSLREIDGRLYAGHNFGVYEILPDNRASEMPVNVGVYQIDPMTTTDGQKALLLSSYYRLRMMTLSSGHITEFDQIDQSVFNAHIDHMGNVWLEHPVKGIFKCRLNRSKTAFESIKFYGGDSGDGLPYKLFSFVVTGRIVMLGNDKFYTYDGLQDKIVEDATLNKCFDGVTGIRRIVEGGHDNRYFAITDHAIYAFEYDGATARIENAFEIPLGNSMVDGYENVAMLDDATDLICLNEGFILYDRSMSPTIVKKLSQPYIETVYASGSRRATGFSPSAKITIPYSQRNIRIDFASKERYAYGLHFRYRLSGIDDAWQTDSTGSVSYDRLSDGEYTFAVEAIDNVGNVSETCVTSFRVCAPWYRTWWAYMFCVGLFAALCYVFYEIFKRQYRQRYMRLLRYNEIIELRDANRSLDNKVEDNRREMFTQASLLMQKNDAMMQLQEMLTNFQSRYGSRTTELPIYRMVSFIKSNLDAESDWKMFLIKFEQRYAEFFTELRKLYPDLTNNDLKLCACLKLNMDSKSIASMMNISVRAIENSRYRLRKKLGIKSEENLNDFFIHFGG